MTQKFDGWRGAWLAGCLLCLAVVACSRQTAGPEQTYEMGVAAHVGTLSYTVIDASWRDAFGSSSEARTPDHSFLVLNISVTNNGAGTTGIPMATLVGSDGKEYRELDKGEDIPGWLGTIRMVDASQSEHGNIVFDVPMGAYKLRVSSGGDPEHEQTALVNIPLRVEAPPSVGGDAAVPKK